MGRKEYVSQKNAEASRDAREIGPLPHVANPARRAACGERLQLFLETYFPNAFPLEWSEDHLNVITAMQTAIVDGGLFALGMPRGSGKTTIAIRAAIFAIVYGYRQFLCMIGASIPAANELLHTIKSELRFNDLLAEDFPEVCVPFRMLEGEPRRCRGQIVDGMRTETEWSVKSVVFPTVPDSYNSRCCGSVISVRGINGQIRGQSRTKPNGEIIRPSLVLVDDPQTRESAHSVSQVNTRMKVVTADILGMAGPGVKISALITATIIKRGDLADQLLDRKSAPEFHGHTARMVYEFPSNEQKWDEYRVIRAEDMTAGGNGSRATEFYVENREEMDRGSRVGWDKRFSPGEVSAIQHAMNLRFRDEIAFFAEYQNDPLDDRPKEAMTLTADQIITKVNQVDRYKIPVGANILTAFIDVQKKMLWYAVVAWKNDFTGYVVDYGAWPDQQRHYFTLSGATKTIETVFPGMTEEQQTFTALNTLTETLVQRNWTSEVGGTPQILSRIIVDANWGPQADTVYAFCRHFPTRNLLIPSHGRGIGVRHRQMAEYTKRDGEKVGNHWRVSRNDGRPVNHVVIDVNYWKSFVHGRFSIQSGAKGSLSLYGNRPQIHQMIADHMCSEVRVRATVEADGRVVDEWTLKPGKPDNHLFDCLVGCAVGADMLGAKITAETVRSASSRPTLRELAERAKAKK